MKKHKYIALTGIMMCCSFPYANAGYKVEIGDGKSIDIGGSIRTNLTSIEDAAPSGEDRSFDFDIHSVRLYMKAKLSKTIGFNIQTERDSEKDVNFIDAYAKFSFSEDLQLWAGRFIPPSDRSNLSGSYNLPVWDYPGIVSKYPNIKAGRDDGVALIGDPLDSKLVYSIGIFDGNEGEDNPSDNPLYSMRLAYSFWDAEGYLTRSTYYGAKDVFTIGVTYVQQDESVSSSSDDTDYTGANIDLLIEKNLGDIGAVTFEAGLYDYIDNGGEDSASQGDATLLSTAYLFPKAIGSGKIQASYRFQEFEPENDALEDTTRSDLGLTYIINGHNARVGVYLYEEDRGNNDEIDGFKIGLQLKL